MTEHYREAWKDWSLEEIENTLKIQALNDQLRKGTVRVEDQIVLTGSLATLDLQDDAEMIRDLLNEVRNFDAFTEDNDPNGEHDMGTFTVSDEWGPMMWKIDYYDADLRFGSDQPWDQSKTRRVLSVFYAEDY